MANSPDIASRLVLWGRGAKLFLLSRKRALGIRDLLDDGLNISFLPGIDCFLDHSSGWGRHIGTDDIVDQGG